LCLGILEAEPFPIFVNMLKMIVILVAGVVAFDLCYAQNEAIECDVSGEAYDELYGYHSATVDTSDQLTFIFHKDQIEELSSCNYFIELNFKQAKHTRGMSNDKTHNLSFGAADSSVMVSLAHYLLISAKEAEEIIGYVPDNAKTTIDGLYYIVDRIGIRFECKEVKKTFRFSSSLE